MSNQTTLKQRIERKKLERPIVDALGRPVRMTANGSAGHEQPAQNDPISGVLYPCYFSLIPALAGSNHGATPEMIVEEAMEIALAACRKIGINITAKNTENP